MPRKERYDKEKLLPLQFRVWDGEGRNFPDGTHRLVLLSNSDGEYLYKEEGLSTIECIKFLLQPRANEKRTRNVWFSFGYDVCKILTDVALLKRSKHDVENLETLWRFSSCLYKGFRIKYIPRKIFTIHAGPKEVFASTDIFSFFQCSFIKACEQWGIEVPDVVRQGKKDRSIFDTYTFEQILEYQNMELQLAKELIDKLYASFKQCDLVPNSWHGPGALAQTYFKSHDLYKHWGKENQEKAMEIPIRHAYFGGRIDISAIGEIECYNYDIVSAYPHALTDCISFENAGWYYQPFPYVYDRHALYHVRWEVPPNTKWGPFPWRTPNGTVLFPTNGEGWYWGVEVLAAERLFPDCIKRIGAWYCWSAKRYPFKELIENEYRKRNEVGRKTGAGIAIKLLLNSLYGKLCQSVGSKRWQNYIWAGYITAFTRAKMLDAIGKLGQENVVAIQTDGIYTKKRMYLNYREKGDLGSWESEGKTTLLLIGAGLFTKLINHVAYEQKSRGMPPNLNHGWILRQWGCWTIRNGNGADSMVSTFSSFIGMGKAIHQHKPFGIYAEETRTVSDVTFTGTSKRIPTILLDYKMKLWTEMELMIRERKPGGPLLSTMYTKNMDIIKEASIDDETADT